VIFNFRLLIEGCFLLKMSGYNRKFILSLRTFAAISRSKNSSSTNINADGNSSEYVPLNYT